MPVPGSLICPISLASISSFDAPVWSTFSVRLLPTPADENNSKPPSTSLISRAVASPSSTPSYHFTRLSNPPFLSAASAPIVVSNAVFCSFAKPCFIIALSTASLRSTGTPGEVAYISKKAVCLWSSVGSPSAATPYFEPFLAHQSGVLTSVRNLLSVAASVAAAVATSFS